MSTEIRGPIAGFSLVELMISVAIMGILASVAAPKYSAYRARGIRTEGFNKIAMIKGAMDSFYANYGVYATCWGSMGVEMKSGYWGIDSQAELRNTGPFVTGDTIARGKGALCPEGVSGALVLNERAFPIAKWGTSCEARYSAVNYGFINYQSSQGDIYINIIGFWRRCLGSAEDFDTIFLGGNPRTGLNIGNSLQARDN